MEQITKRLLKIINERAGGKSSVFAKEAGISQATFHNYTKGRMPNAESLYNICNIYNVNINWLLTGEGDVYIKDKNKKNYVAEKTPIYNKKEDPETADLIEAARRVLKSGNLVAFDALERNIRYFDHATKTEARLKHMEKKIKAIEENIKKSDRIRKGNNKDQRGEILKRRATQSS